jgi:protease-4
MENNLPPIPPPPPIPPMAQTPILVTAPRSNKGWMFLSFVLFFILALIILGKISSAILSSKQITGSESGHHFEEVTVENADAPDKIAIVDVTGIITSEPWDRSGRSMVEKIDDQLKVAGKDKDVKAAILKVDSPGGEVLASDDISRSIVQFQDRYHKPIVASMGGLAASGGYYVSAPCTWIVANELTITGSIGVIMHTLNYRGLMDKIGLAPKVFKSGKHKDMLSGSKEPSQVDPEEEKMVQDMIMETYGKFKKVVQDGRDKANKNNGGKGKKLDSNWQEYADGRVLTGKMAYDLGFVDELGNFQNAVDTTKKIAGVSGKARLIRYQEPFDLSKIFGMFGKSDAKNIKVEIGLDLPKLQAGRPYFILPTFVP